MSKRLPPWFWNSAVLGPWRGFCAHWVEHREAAGAAKQAAGGRNQRDKTAAPYPAELPHRSPAYQLSHVTKVSHRGTLRVAPVPVNAAFWKKWREEGMRPRGHHWDPGRELVCHSRQINVKRTLGFGCDFASPKLMKVEPQSVSANVNLARVK
jgi:hypothetical protein